MKTKTNLSSNALIITLASSIAFVVNAADEYPVVIDKAGTGDGFITITATPQAGSIFTGWSGDCSGTASCTVPLDDIKTITANFDIAPLYNLTVNNAGNGTVVSNPVGISCGNGANDCSEEYEANSTVNLTAVASSGYQFSKWSGCTSYNGNTCTVSMTEDTTVDATFTNVPSYTLSVTKSGKGGISSYPTGISCPAESSPSYPEGSCVAPYAATKAYPANTKVTLTAQPSQYYSVKWTGCTSSSGNTCYATMTGNKNVSATFTANTMFKLQVGKEPGGTASSNPAGINCGSVCSASFLYDTTVKITAYPAAGYTFVGWTGCPQKYFSPICTLQIKESNIIRPYFEKK